LLVKAYSFLLAIAVTGCGGDPDAGPDATVYNYDFTCLQNNLPITAPATIRVQGIAQEVYTDAGRASLQVLADADIVACRKGGPCTDTDNYGTARSAADGAWAFNPDPVTDGAPLDVFMYVQKLGDRTTYLWPNSPLYADNLQVKVPVMLNAFVAQLSALGIQQSPAKSIVGVLLVDCADQPIVDSDNVKVTLKLDGAEIPSLSFIDAHIFNEDFNGDFFLLNVPIGDIEVGATYKDMPLRAHTITTFPGTTSETKLAPGFRPTS
jgi:hypothetical protein